MNHNSIIKAIVNMKKIISNILTGVVGVAASTVLWGCVAENPFESEGTGIVQLRTVVNSITTRADEGGDQSLEDKCVVYISGKQGLLYKKQGLDNVDDQISLKAGSYVAEAWTGDSVTASFDKKFYRGYQPFDVTKGGISNVVLNCRIANVVASVNTSTINPVLMKDDYKITIRNSRGELTFTKDNAVDAKAYFMMPNGDDKLEYTIEGTRKDGDPFTKTGVIENVERAHHYILNFEYNPDDPQNPSTGAVFIKINIKDEVITNDNITVFSRPTLTGVDFDIEKQLNFVDDDNIPEVVSVQICGDKLDDIELTLGCCTWKVVLNLDTSNDDKLSGKRPLNFGNLKSEDPLIEFCKNHGLEYIAPVYDPETKIETAHLNFSRDIFTRLLRNAEEHVFSIRVTDAHGQETVGHLRIARDQDAVVIEDPIEFDQVDQNDWKKITSGSATLDFSLADNIEGVPGVEYSVADEDDWTFVPVNTRSSVKGMVPMKASKKYSVTIDGLKAGTEYKYRACCGDFHSSQIMKFKTFSKFVIPNGNMEQWASVNGVGGQNGIRLPSRTGNLDFWGNGNPGAKKASTVLTDESSDMFRSGSKSARLESKFANIAGLGKFAAGNLFAGEYVKTDGTDGVLSFGQPFEAFAEDKNVDLHPTALRVFVNYRPKVGVNKRGASSGYIAEGQLDKAQIYVALTTAPIEIRTKKTNQKLFNKDDKEVLAYGQATLESDYGPDGQLQELVIPIEYFDSSVQPTHLVIVCSASIYGDFFSGGEGSTMYLDDFELIYE